ncbi:MAG: hypothetical protein RLY86_3973 [Pseudomonadota bacterium]|jgi:RimJ/RimL family protein N-acetyltransferase
MLTGPLPRLLTDRLVGHPLGPADFADLRRLHGNATAMATLSADGRPLPEARTAKALSAAEIGWTMDAIAAFALHRREAMPGDGGGFIGYAGIRRAANPLDPGGVEVWELLYGLMPAAWGQGYGTEAGRAVLADAQDRLGIRTVWAWTLWTNQASRGLMARLGFVQVGGAVYSGLPHVVSRRDG